MFRSLQGHSETETNVKREQQELSLEDKDMQNEKQVAMLQCRNILKPCS